MPAALFAGSVTVPPAEGLHQIRVTATDDIGRSAAATVMVSVHIASGFPRFTPTAGPIEEVLPAVGANRDLCTSIYLDTLESQGHTEWIPFGGDFEGEDHHQGLARTHQLSDGSIVFFLSHSETDEGDKGNLMHFRYAGPTEGEHVLATEPLTVAPMTQLLEIEDQHPCDMSFLPEVGGADAGYLFVAEQTTLRVRVYRWSPADGLVVHGIVDLPHLTVGPNFVFLGVENDRYLLGVVASYPDGDARSGPCLHRGRGGPLPGRRSRRARRLGVPADRPRQPGPRVPVPGGRPLFPGPFRDRLHRTALPARLSRGEGRRRIRRRIRRRLRLRPPEQPVRPLHGLTGDAEAAHIPPTRKDQLRQHRHALRRAGRAAAD